MYDSLIIAQYPVAKEKAYARNSEKEFTRFYPLDIELLHSLKGLDSFFR